MKRILSIILFAALVLLLPGCKSAYILTNDIKSLSQGMTPGEAAVKLNSIIEKDKTGATIGLEDVVWGGSTGVTKDSITFSKTIAPQKDKSSNSFTSGYETAASYTEKRDIVVTVKFNTVKSVKIREYKDGHIRSTIRDDQSLFVSKPMFQFDTPVANRDLIIALFSVLIPDAKIVYSGGASN